jgi:hypothetical protein
VLDERLAGAAATPVVLPETIVVERTFDTINALFCQHLPGYTGSDVTRRGPDTEKDACHSVPTSRTSSTNGWCTTTTAPTKACATR